MGAVMVTRCGRASIASICVVEGLIPFDFGLLSGRPPAQFAGWSMSDQSRPRRRPGASCLGRSILDPPHLYAHNAYMSGVRFADAEGVLGDPHAITVDDTHPDEQRFVSLGLDMVGRIVVVVYDTGETSL